jgi:hypothetical protein
MDIVYYLAIVENKIMSSEISDLLDYAMLMVIDEVGREKKK